MSDCPSHLVDTILLDRWLEVEEEAIARGREAIDVFFCPNTGIRIQIRSDVWAHMDGRRRKW